MAAQALQIVHEAVGAAIPDPQRYGGQAAPEDEPEDQLDPEEHGAVRHVEDLEADEEQHYEREERGHIGLGHDAREERREVRLRGFEHAEGGGDDFDGRREEGRREEVREVG